MTNLPKEQDNLMDLADLIIHPYAIDVTLTRPLPLIADNGYASYEEQRATTRDALTTSSQLIRTTAENLLANLSQGKKLETHLQALDRLSFHPRVDLIGLRRIVADLVVERERYPF